jgi:hypothetical protein
MKYTFLSKWTVLILTVLTFGLGYYGYRLIGEQQAGSGLLALAIGALIYAVAWIVAFFDSIQERRLGWVIGLVVLLPVGIGPILYSVIGPRNTR